jgi:tRNA/rRNA methyltransferase
MPLSNVRVVLVRPRGAANVGAAARAMKNMGLRDLMLVRPALMKSFWARAMAAHAEDVLHSVRQTDTLGEAVADCGLVVGTTCRGGLYRGAAEPPRVAAPPIAAAAATNRVALLFGPEDHGLSNEDLKACHRLIAIPADPAYASLNLAQAVMVCCYELYLAAAGEPPAARALAPAEHVDLMFQKLQAAFRRIGFLHPDNPDHIMFAFRRVLGRAQLETHDVNILLGLARQIEWFGNGGHAVMAVRAAGTPPVGSVDEQQARPSRRTRKDGASSGRTDIFFERNTTTVRPEEPPPPGGVSKGGLARKSTVPVAQGG